MFKIVALVDCESGTTGTSRVSDWLLDVGSGGVEILERTVLGHKKSFYKWISVFRAYFENYRISPQTAH